MLEPLLPKLFGSFRVLVRMPQTPEARRKITYLRDDDSEALSTWKPNISKAA